MLAISKSEGTSAGFRAFGRTFFALDVKRIVDSELRFEDVMIA